MADSTHASDSGMRSTAAFWPVGLECSRCLHFEKRGLERPGLHILSPLASRWDGQHRPSRLFRADTTHLEARPISLRKADHWIIGLGLSFSNCKTNHVNPLLQICCFFDSFFNKSLCFRAVFWPGRIEFPEPHRGHLHLCARSLFRYLANGDQWSALILRCVATPCLTSYGGVPKPSRDFHAGEHPPPSAVPPDGGEARRGGAGHFSTPTDPPPRPIRHAAIRPPGAGLRLSADQPVQRAGGTRAAPAMPCRPRQRGGFSPICFH